MEQGNSRKQDYAEARRTNYLLEIQSLPDKNTKNNHSSFKLLNSCFANKSVSLTCENKALTLALDQVQSANLQYIHEDNKKQQKLKKSCTNWTEKIFQGLA